MDLAIERIDSRQGDLEVALRRLRDKLSPRGEVVSEAGRRRTIDVFGEPLSPQQVVEKICRDVRHQGLDAVLDYSKRLDGKALDRETMCVRPEELDEAHRRAAPEFLSTIRRIQANITEFQQAITHHDREIHRADGTHLRQRYLPLQRVGICIPGGAAAYPSSVLMTAVPAQVAGVNEIAVVAPPTEFGANNPDILATCRELGVSEVYRVGGAHAVAALAYGVDGIPPVDKIVGPGNLFVALAKKHVYGEVDIDSIAGPSEVVVLADRSTRPDFAAADMLAQAEHAPGSSILVSWDSDTIDATFDELQRQVGKLDRDTVTIQSLIDFGALIRVRDADEACHVANQIAPEHLHIATQEPGSLLDKITAAGAIFLGPFSPVAVGDYVAGPSHVLPTGGTARWASGLSANDFLRSSSVIQYSESALDSANPDIQQMASREGLTAHGASVAIRRQGRDGECE